MTSKIIFWCNEPSNFGDVLTKNLLSHLNVTNFTHTNNSKKANVFILGSVARLAAMSSSVFGSGVIRKNEESNPLAKWKFVRGPLTRKNVLKYGGICPDIYCDPALLLPTFCEESEKEYEIGIVPHYQHYNIMKQMWSKYKVIDIVNDNPLHVAKEITKCKKIISSSLHGIICAHAYGIPAARINGHNKLWGDGIKFEDYYMSVKANSEISTIERPKFTDAVLPNIQQIENILKDNLQ